MRMKYQISRILCVLVILVSTNNFAHAQKGTVDSLVSLLSTTISETGKIPILKRIAEISFRAFDKENFQRYSAVGLAIADRHGLKEEQAFFHNALGLAAATRYEFDKALEHYEAAGEVFQLVNDIRGVRKIKYNMGRVYATKNNHLKAVEYFSQSIPLLTQVIKEDAQTSNRSAARMSRRYLAETYNNLGSSYLALGRYKESIESHLEGIKESELLLTDIETKEDKSAASKLLADSYTSLGTAYSKHASLFHTNGYVTKAAKEKYEKALEMHFASMDIKRQLLAEAQADQNATWSNIYETDIAIAYNNISVIYYQQKELNKAINYLSESFDIFQRLKKYVVASDVSNNIGNVYKEWGQEALNRNEDSAAALFKKAFSYWGEAYKISEEIGDKARSAGSLNNMGIGFILQKKYDTAIAVLKMGLAAGQETEHKEWIKFSLENLAQAYAGKKDHKLAYEYYQKYVSMKDSMVNAESSLQIEELRTKYETAKKDNEISALNQQKASQDLKLKEQQAFLLHQQLLGLQKEKDLQFAIQEKEIQHLELDRKDLLLNSQKSEIDLKENKLAIAARDHAIQAAILSNTQKNRNMIIATLLGLFLFSGTIYYFRRQKKELVLQHKITETELNLFRSQMNPHFMFNALNSIHSYVVTNDTDNAAAYLEKFSQLMRIILENSTNSLVTLADDLKALDLYLELESERLAHKFSYKIEVDKAIDPNKVLVPPMILQPFLENSVWHGMQKKEKGGEIQLYVGMKGDLLECTITDNGNGFTTDDRSRSAGKKSYGINITRQRLENLNKTNRVNAYCDVIEIMDEHSVPKGVKVKVGIPLELEA
jgi:tetratricopeptide (TPR) repeat protein